MEIPKSKKNQNKISLESPDNTKIIFLKKKINKLKKRKENLEDNLKEKTNDQKEYLKILEKYNKLILASIIVSLIIIILSMFFLAFNIQKEFQFSESLTLHMEKEFWSNFFFLGLSIFAISFIFYQLKQSTLNQMQINLFWREWDELESLIKEINIINLDIVRYKAKKYVNKLPILCFKNKKLISREALKPENVKDPDLKFFFEEIKDELENIHTNFNKKRKNNF